MSADKPGATRSLFVPEIIQTSAMDCGPAALKSILQGLGLSVGYASLREACQTDVDGTSIDALEDIAAQLGFDSAQIMVPVDHVLMPQSDSLPAIAIVRMPNGQTHFIVIWRVHRWMVQIMDPASGRGWWLPKRLLRQLYVHSHPMDEETCFDWLTDDDFIHPLRVRMSGLSLGAEVIDALITDAVDSGRWQHVAALDAATRMCELMVRAGGSELSPQLERVLSNLYKNASADGAAVIPARYWSAMASPEHEGAVLIRGAVLLRIANWPDPQQRAAARTAGDLPRNVARAIDQPEVNPLTQIVAALPAEGRGIYVLLALALALATGGVLVEVMLLKSLTSLDQVSRALGSSSPLATGVYALVAVLLLLELPIIATTTYVGRWLELRLRIALLEKIPRLGDRYFRTRPASDIAQRAYDLRGLRELPDLATAGLRRAVEFALTALGLIWLYPSGAWLIVVGTGVLVVALLLPQPALRDLDLRVRTHCGALSRFYLDALLGIAPIRTHRAEESMQTEHEAFLVKWSDAGTSLYFGHLVVQAVTLLVSSGLAIWIVFGFVRDGGHASGVILVLYWALKLPLLGRGIVDVLQRYHMNRSCVWRLAEMLTSSDEADEWYEPDARPETEDRASGAAGVAIDIRDGSVQAGGHVILSDVDLAIGAGEHVAVVGASGAGKSSLVGLLLGWHRPVTGEVRVDGQLLHGDWLVELRERTAWVDPAVRLWNRTLDDNLRYGEPRADASATRDALSLADLGGVAARLPDGARTPLGEGGGLVSGGEGQRVRFGRALARSDVRLVILDEPFRGLDRAQRQRMLMRARERWRHTTLIFISHDIRETLSFERVIVMDAGRVVEDAPPELLSGEPDSRYSALRAGEDMVRTALWEGDEWRRLWLEDGRLTEPRSWRG